MRTPKDIVEEYRRRGYSDEKIRIIALSRPESLRVKIMEYLEGNPAEGEGETTVVKQYLPLRKDDDEGAGGTGAVPEEEPLETEEAAQPIEVPDEAAEPVAAPLRMASASQDEEGEETGSESNRIVALAREEKDLSSAARAEEEAESPADEGESAEPVCADVRANLAKAKRREERLSSKAEKLAEALREKDERIRALEEGAAELERGSLEGDELRTRLEERDCVVRDLEMKIEGQDAKLEETVTSHIEEMHRIIDAYEGRIKAVRAQGLKGNLVAFASAACVLLVFLVSLTVRGKQPDVRLVPVDVAVETGIVEEAKVDTLTAGGGVDLPGTMQGREAGTTHGFNLQTGETFAISETPAQAAPGRAAGVSSGAAAGAASRQEQSIRYVVQKNDTLWSICKRYLGSGNLYREVARDNKLGTMRLQPGQVLVINLKHKD